MSKIEPNDEFLVQRSSTSFKTKASDLMSTIEDTDLMLIQRGISSFKVTCEDVKDQLGGGGVTGSIDTPVAVLTPLNGAGTNDGQPYKPLSTAITAVGVGGSAEFKTDTIASVNGNVLTFPSAKDFDKFEVGDVVQPKAWTLNKIIYSPAGDRSGGKGYLKYITVNGSPILKPEWASLCSVTDSRPGTKVNVWDGSIDTSWNISNSATPIPAYTIDFTLLPIEERPKVVDGLEMWGFQTKSDSKMQVKYIFLDENGTEQTEIVSTAPDTGGTYAFIPQNSLDAMGEVVTITSPPDVANKTITVDGGSWYGADGTGDAGDGRYEPQQEWSNYGSGTPISEYPWTNTFDGNPSTGAVSLENSTITWDYGSTLGSSATIYMSKQSNAIATITINGSTTNASGVSYESMLPADNTQAPIVVGGGLNTLVVARGGGQGSGVYTYSIEIDGKPLIDSSIPGAQGATDISKTVTSDASLTFTSSSELANMVGPLSQVDATGAVKTPVTSTITKVENNDAKIKTINGTASGGAFVEPPSSGDKSPGWKNAFNGVIDSYLNGARAATSTSALLELSSDSFIRIIAGDKVRFGFDNSSSSIKLYWSGGAAVLTLLQGTAGVTDLGGNLYEYDLSAYNGYDLTAFRSEPSGVAVSTIVGIQSQGEWVLDIEPTITLTLTDDTDLQYFKVGDLVQSEFTLNQNQNYSEGVITGSYESGGSYSADWDKAFDGNLVIGNINGIYDLAATTSSYTLRFPAPEPIATNLELVYMNEVALGDRVIIYTDVGSTSLSLAQLPQTGTDVQSRSAPFTVADLGNATSILGFDLVSNGAGWTGIAGVFIDGLLLADTDVVLDGVKVISPPDLVNNQMTVDGGDWLGADGSGDPSGETVVTGPPLVASANDVEYLDGNTLGVNGVSGSWRVGLNAQGAEVTASAPSPESIQYTSANGDPLTTEFTGVDATLTTRTWTWQVSNAATGPWTDFATRTDTPGQDGATPLADRPTLEEKKFYQVKVQYGSNNAAAVESTFNTFKTGVNS